MSYAPPDDPLSLFEERRWSMARIWGLRRWRVANSMSQVRGRNQRTKTDLGVCVFMDKRFKKFIGSLSAELQQACVTDKTFDECMKEAKELLG